MSADRRVVLRGKFAAISVDRRTVVDWSATLVGLAFVALFLARLPTLIEHVYWDSDAATAPMIAQTFGHGHVILERFGWFTALWFELLTKPLPLHRQIWETAPYLFALGSAALLAACSWKLAGRWAAAMTATVALVTSPFVSYDLVTLNYHTTTWFATMVLGVFCLWAASDPPTSRLVFASVLVTAFAGTTLASDWLFAFTGFIPYAAVGVVLVAIARLRAPGVAIIVSAATSPLIAWATRSGMRAAHVTVFPVPTRFADAKDLWPNVGTLAKGIIQLANGDSFFGATLGVRSVLSFACALLVLCAMAAPFVLVRRQLLDRTHRRLLAYSCFWASSVALTCVAFVLSSEGTHGGYYLIPILYALAATVPLVADRNNRVRSIAAAAIAVVALASLVNLADTKTEFFRALPPVTPVAAQVVEKAKENNALNGYADYWDASSLTWNEHGQVHVAPASQCAIGQAKTDLCGYWFNVNTRWYQPHAGSTFVLRDEESQGLRQALPPSYGAPSATYRLSNAIVMYVFPYDVVRRFIYLPRGS